MKYQATIKRMYVWRCEIEANSKEEAKDKAYAMVQDWPPNDDYAYDTTVIEVD